MAAVMVTFTTIISFVIFSHNPASTITYNHLDYQATLMGNGDLRVTQTIDLTLKHRNKPYRQIYQQYILDPRNLTGVTDITVKNLANGEEYFEGEPVASNRINSYSNGTWDKDHAGTWYLSTVDSSTGGSSQIPWSGELELQTPDTSDPRTMLGARVTDDNDDSESFLDQTALDSQPIELGWNIPSTTSAKSMKFQVSMTLKNIATSYNDITGFQWEPIGVDNSTPIKQLTGTIRLPKSITNEDDTLKAWMHYTGNGKIKLDKNTVNFTASNISPNSYIDLIVIGRGDAVNAKRYVNTSGFDKITQAEDQMESEWKTKNRVKSIGLLALWVLIAVTTIFLLFMCVKTAIKVKRGMTYNSDIEYWREAPEVSPAEAAMLYEITTWSGNGKFNHEDRNALTATMMSLVAKGYISVYPGGMDLYHNVDLLNDSDEVIARMVSNNSQESHHRFFGGKDKTDNNSTIVLRDPIWNGGAPLYDTEKNLVETLKITADVLHSRVFDFNMINQAIRSRHGRSDVSDLSDVFQMVNAVRTGDVEGIESLGTSKSDSKRLISAWRHGFETSRLKEWKNDCLTESLGKMSAAWYWILALLAVVIGIVSRSSAIVVFYSIPIIVISMFLFGFIGTFSKLTDRGQKMAGEVQGLARYLLDFSDFKDRDVLDVVLWGEYMTYATAFGIAPKVVEQLKQAQIDYDMNNSRHNRSRYDNGYHAAWYGSSSLVYWSTCNNGMGFSEWDLGSSINDAISDVQSTISSITNSGSSGGSGGSSFGGSSGGSGGGSFGAR